MRVIFMGVYFLRVLKSQSILSHRGKAKTSNNQPKATSITVKRRMKFGYQVYACKSNNKFNCYLSICLLV